MEPIIVNVGDKVAGGEIVQAPCDQKNNGHWFCVTHQKTAHNQFAKDVHISTPGRHILAWLCNEHGLEQP